MTASIPCHNGRSRCPLKFLMPPTRRQPWLSTVAGYSVNRGMHAEWPKNIKQGRVLCGSCELWHGIETRVTCVVASVAAASNDSRCVNYCRTGVRLAALTSTAVCGVSAPRRLARICMCGSVPAGRNLCSYWFGLGTAAIGSFNL